MDHPGGGLRAKQKETDMQHHDEGHLIEDVTLWRYVYGWSDEEIGRALGWSTYQVTAFAMEYRIPKRKGPRISPARQQWAELQHRLPIDENERYDALVAVNGFLRERVADRRRNEAEQAAHD
jgi:hypothetical protein